MSYQYKPTITMTGYEVRYVDMREDKPRAVYTEVFPLDKATIEAVRAVGLDVPAFISGRYERGGYHVISVDKLPAKRQASIDLLAAWDAAQ